MKNIKIAIIGLGYVGLPLARLFATKFPVVGFDINQHRVDQLKLGFDKTNEVPRNKLKEVVVEKNTIKKGLFLTYAEQDMCKANFFIITVPTYIDKKNKPVLTPLLNASKSVANVLKKGDIVVYESTVYPGATEDDCVPILEKNSKLLFNKDFYVGYSPERINPGDKKRRVDKILKIVSGSTKEISLKINDVYSSVISAGTHLAPSIKVAEAAKVIENTQRDINIAFVNELAKIFELMGINTQEVLEVAATKWNFSNFKPGLVGGHCIGIDSYYLAQKAKDVGYNSKIILAGRSVNESMGKYVASQVIKLMIQKNIKIKGSKILILGITFKENCPDIRNTKIVDLVNELKEHDANITIYDPYADVNEVKLEYKLNLSGTLPNKKFDGIVLAVAHKKFKKLNFKGLKKNNSIFYDVKGLINSKYVDKVL